MATDIAFSLAILRLLGDRVPLSLKIFLTAFAIVDDLGAVIVIALFYSSGIQWMLLLYAFILLAVLFFLAWRGIYLKYLILLFGAIIWYLFLKAGIHPTIAGVIVAFSVPIRQKINIATYTHRLTKIVDRIKKAENNDVPILTREQIAAIDNLEDWTFKVQSPLQHLEHKLHNIVSYFIMPVFALANAGVAFSLSNTLDWGLIINLPLALIFGNVIGILFMAFIGTKLKLVALPEGISNKQLIGVSFLAGVGFTMSIFIASIAFASDAVSLDSAKIGILLGSLVAGIIGYIILSTTGKK
jgi:NhaA family Na+:H+ antiporter